MLHFILTAANPCASLITLYCGSLTMNWFFNKKKSDDSRLKSRKPLSRKEKLLKLSQSDAYYSVSITRCGCQASSKLIGKCFTFDTAPDLPLADCDAAQCTCEYQGMLNKRRCQRRIMIRRKSIRMDSDRRKNDRRASLDSPWNKYSV